METIASVEELNLLKNTIKTVAYLSEAIQEQDYETAKLEYEELRFSLKRLEDMKQKRDRKKLLMDLVVDMQRRGINIDVARHSSFLKNRAKNADEKSLYNSKIHKKRQQA